MTDLIICHLQRCVITVKGLAELNTLKVHVKLEKRIESLREVRTLVGQELMEAFHSCM